MSNMSARTPTGTSTARFNSATVRASRTEVPSRLSRTWRRKTPRWPRVGAGEEPTVLRRGAHRGVTATVAVDQFRHQARHGLGQDTGIAAQEHVVAPTLDMVDGEADDVGRVLAVEKHEQTGNSVAQTDAVIDEQPADEN